MVFCRKMCKNDDLDSPSPAHSLDVGCHVLSCLDRTISRQLQLTQSAKQQPKFQEFRDEGLAQST